jgi:hypothetical protein
MGGGPHSQPSSSVRRKAKKNQPVFTLEEIFNQASSATESSLNAPAGRIVLTPRSAEACLKLGVNPEILKIRDIDSFWEPGIEASVQRLRHEAYVQRRHETMKQCRLERKRIINASFDSHGGFEPGDEGLTPEQLLKKQQEQSSTLIQMELARIEKMQKRQEKELEQMIQYEINRAKLQEDMTERIEASRRKEEERKRQADRRARLAAEEKRLKEMQRAAMEEMEEENRRQIARAMHEKEKELADKREADLKAYKVSEGQAATHTPAEPPFHPIFVAFPPFKYSLFCSAAHDGGAEGARREGCRAQGHGAKVLQR